MIDTKTPCSTSAESLSSYHFIFFKPSFRIIALRFLLVIPERFLRPTSPLLSLVQTYIAVPWHKCSHSPTRCGQRNRLFFEARLPSVPLLLVIGDGMADPLSIFLELDPLFPTQVGVFQGSNDVVEFRLKLLKFFAEHVDLGFVCRIRVNG